MAIDYTRRKPNAPEPPERQEAAGSAPSWYTPPVEAEQAPAAVAPALASPVLPPAPPRAQPTAPAAAPAQPPPPAPPASQPTADLARNAGTSGVSLHKVTLTAAAPQISLTKSGGAGGVIHINLNWSAGAPKPAAGGGFFKRLAAAASKGVDLDLGCLYELTDGSKGVVQALGNSFGSLSAAPWIKLDGDDRTGNVAGGENMSINLEQPGRFRRILIFAMIYEGAPNWAAVDGVVTLIPVNGPQVEVRLDATDQAARICAVAEFTNAGGDLVVQREVRYINGGQSMLDQAYGWGMNWSPGRK